jgi:hypothetical protein
MKTTDQLNWHTRIDARNRELHEVIATKLRQNPVLILQVRDTLRGWIEITDESDRSRSALLEWQRRLDTQSLEQLIEFISSEDEEACRLRQSTPFVGLLTEDERLAVFQRYEAFRS